MQAPQYQRWTITIPGVGREPNVNNGDVKLEVYIANLWVEETAMRALIERADVGAYMEYAEPPETVV